MIEERELRAHRNQIGVSLLLASLGVYVILNLWIVFASNAHALLNDFWFLFRMSEYFNWNNPANLYDGFFPYLFPLVLKFIPQSSILMTTAFISLLASVLTISFTYFAARIVVGPLWGLIAVWIVALQPQSFTYSTVPGADPLATLPVSIALWILIREWNKPNPQRLKALALAGLLIGLGASLRYHVLLIAAIPLILAAISKNKKVQGIGYTLGGFVIGYLPQIIINLAAGQPPWSTLQSFNIYRQAVGVDWNSTDNLDPYQYSSALTVIANNPAAFTTNYLVAFSNFVFPLVVIALAALLLHGSRWRTIMWALFAGSAIFAVVSSAAFSDRTLIAFTPIWAIAGAVVSSKLFSLGSQWCIPRYRDRGKSFFLAAATLTGVFLLWGTFPWIQAGLNNGVARFELEQSRIQYEREFLKMIDVTSMDQVFSNDFNFYTTKVEGLVPQHNGGFAAIGKKGSALAPAIDLLNTQSFLCESLRRDLQAVIWNPGNGSGTGSELNDILSGITPNEQILPWSVSGLVMSAITLKSDPCT